MARESLTYFSGLWSLYRWSTPPAIARVPRSSLHSLAHFVSIFHSGEPGLVYSESGKSGDLERESVSITSHKFSARHHLLASFSRDRERDSSSRGLKMLLIRPEATDKPDCVYCGLTFKTGLTFDIIELNDVRWGFFTGCRCRGGAAPTGI